MKSLFMLTLLSTCIYAAEIHDTARSGDLAAVEALLEKNPDLLNACDDRNATALHFACDSGHADVAALLIEKSANLDARDVDGDTPLHWAAHAGHAKLVALLLEKNVDIQAKNKNSATPLHYAALNGRLKVIDLLIANGADMNAKNHEDETPLIWAVLRKNKKTTLALLEKGADIEAGDARKRTPLLLVARETGDPKFARILIDHGANIDVIDKYGDTPLSLAAWRGFKPLVDLLLDRGARFDAKGKMGTQLLMYAVNRKLDRLFSLLAEQGADLDIQSDRGGSLLQSAANGGSVKIVEILIEKGMDIDATDRYGWTALHHAAYRGREDVARLLLAKDCDPDLRSLSGKTPLNLAEDYKHDAVASFLKEKGVDPGTQQFPTLKGAYLGQPDPGDKPRLFAPDIVSTSDGVHGSITFTPDGREAYWASVFILRDEGYSDGAILSTRMDGDRWTPTRFASFTDGLITDDDVPFCSPDGKRIYFISRRPLRAGERNGKENIWYVEKNGESWAEPRMLGPEVNARDVHWQISVSKKGSLYFGCGRDGICCSRLVNDRHTEVVPIQESSDHDLSGGSPFIAPDESYLLFSSMRKDGIGGGDLYVTFRDKEGAWSKPVNLGPSVNSPSHENCPIVSPDGKYLFFISQRNGRSSIFWVEAGIIERLRNSVS